MGDPEDELARTATAPGARSGAPQPELGAMLGRYHLERMLGEGGMGVVHAAFDPDLERRVALKVLRSVDQLGDARQRLLREARAMARLTHENVVVVHEVGTANDRDYVAMELIDGQTLAEWLAGKPREVAHIVEAFCAAGRGLAAAHAAGLVHRDFKPHNVLRRRDGRIVVTDFGLARGVDAGPLPAPSPAVGFDVTLRPGAAAGSQPSGLSGLTVSGAVLGTPAYMAPEQWTGGTVGPPADQFAFCVALWEALTGARPFKGETVEELKSDVRRGPETLDQSKLPRRLRRTLVRGLDPDPAKRWPNMDALLARIARADRHVGIAFLIAGGALVAGGVAMVALHHGAPACDPPALDPSTVWSKAFAAGVSPGRSELFNAQVSHWAVARATACTADPIARPQQLHCLDQVLARMDVIRKAYDGVAKQTEEDLAGNLVDPSVCLTPSPPRLTLADSPDTVAAFNLIARGDADPKHAPLAEARAFADRPGLDPCSRALALIAVENAEDDYPAKRAALADSLAASEQCDDERLQAELLLMNAPYQFELPMIGPRGMHAIERASASIDKVKEPQLTARVDILRSYVASQQDHWKDAYELSDHAIEAYANANLPRAAVRAALEGIELRLNRNKISDINDVRAIVAKWLPAARGLDGPDDHHLAVQLERDDALARYWLGDVAGGHAELMRLWKPVPDAKRDRKIDGEVVDQRGRPVAGATVAAGGLIYTDSVGVLPLSRYHLPDYHLRIVTTDDHGHFVIPDGPDQGAVFAQLGDRRSIGAAVGDHVRLVVLPTRRLAGKVTLGGFDYTQAQIVIEDPNDPAPLLIQQMAMSMPDGSFSADGVQQTKVAVGVATSHDSREDHVRFMPVPAGHEPVTGLKLDATATTRTLDTLVRSKLTTPIETAQILLFPGRQHFATAGQLNAAASNGLNIATQFGAHVTGEDLPKPLVPKYRAGDLIAHFTDVPAGDVTVCAVGLPNDLMDREAMRKIQAHISELEVDCEVVDGQAESVLVLTSPPKNFD
ncbi:MAG: serine/threonine-protein kinase [Kofleriaceae bacterium]